MSCGRRLKAQARWRREVRDEFATELSVLQSTKGRRAGTSRRDDLHALSRTTVGTHAGAGSFSAHAELRRMPDAAASDGKRIAAFDASNAGRRRAVACAHRDFPGACAALHAMGMDGGIWTRRYGGLCDVYRLYRTLAAKARTGRIWRNQFAEHADFSRLFLEGMAVDDFTCGSAGPGDVGGVRGDRGAKAFAARVGAGAGADRAVRGICVRASSSSHGISQRPQHANRKG